MSVSIVIPNYNGELVLKKNLPVVVGILEDYARNTHQEIELIINDDGSKDGSSAILQNLSEKKSNGLVKFIILFNERNFGFSTTVNRGVKKATGDIVVLLNNDVRPDKGFLEPLLSHFSDQKVFAVGCMDKSIEPHGLELRGRGIGSWRRGFLMHERGDLERDNTLWVSGGSGAFRRSIWVKLGGLSEIMNPFYWEDIDLSYRGWKAGYKMVFEKASTVVHEHEEGVIKKTATPERVQITALRNQFLFVWINITDSSLILSHFLWLPYHLVRAISRADWVFIRGFFAAVFKFPETFRYRARNKKLFSVSDKAILDLFKK